MIVPYSLATKHEHAVRRRQWDVVILDESHFCKNPRAQRTQAILGRRHKNPERRLPALAAPIRLALTGTPIPNRPVELWPVLRWLDEPTWGNWMSFIRRFCEGYKMAHGWSTSGATNLDVLQDRLRATVMVRRLKSQVLKDLPAKTRQVVLVEATADAKAAIKSEQGAWTRHERRAEQLQLEVELAKASTRDEYQRAVEKMRAGVRVSLEEISAERHRVAVAKAPMVADWCKEALNGGRKKLCVFAHHKDVVALLRKELAEFAPLVLTGETPTDERQRAVDAFQADPRHRVFIGSITAAGVGLTLTAADHAVFAELDWVPSTITQAEDRIHRIGQQEAVLIQHIVFQGSLDQKMADLIVDKQRIADESLDLEFASEPLLPSAARAIDATRAAIERDAGGLSAADIENIHGQLQFLLQTNSYSSTDAALGARLGELRNLSPKQAALGARILVKYRRQLEGLL